MVEKSAFEDDNQESIEDTWEADLNPEILAMTTKQARQTLKAYFDFSGRHDTGFTYSKTELWLLACFINPPPGLPRAGEETVIQYMRNNMVRIKMRIAEMKRVATVDRHVQITIRTCGITIGAESSEHSASEQPQDKQDANEPALVNSEEEEEKK